MSLSRYRKLFAETANPARRRRSHGPRLRFEALEDRTVLSFATAPIFPAGNSPVAVVSADFNGDGKADAAVVNENSNTVSVLLGSGDGSFEPAQNYAVATVPDSVVAADFNGDGKLDLAVTAIGGLTVLLGNGDGNFQAGITTSEPSEPHGAVAGDFNGDGKLDLAVANSFSALVPAGARGTLVVVEFGTFSILPGNGDGTFQAPQDPTLPPGFLFNADADPQLATIPVPGGDELAVTMMPSITQPSSAQVQTFQDGPAGIVLTGTYPIFTAPATIDPGVDANLSPDAETVGDFNGDGIADLAVSGLGQGSILLGNADGTFQPALNPPNLHGPAIAGDFNGDGKSDLALVGSDTVTILISQGDGSFQTGTIYGAGQPFQTATNGEMPPPTFGSAIADFNGDGHADLAVVAAAGLEVLTGRGDGTFQAAPAYPSGSQKVVGDFNGDGIADLVVNVNFNTIGILMGRPDGTFAPEIDLPVPNVDTVTDIQTADLNGDGRSDLILVMAARINFPTGSFGVLLSNGDGTFRSPPAGLVVSASVAPINLAVGDFNGDGVPDVMYDGLVLLGNGDGTLRTTTTNLVLPSAADFAVGDFNGDGKLDLAATTNPTDPSRDPVAIYLGNGDGSFRAPVTYAAGNGPIDLEVGDFNGDGRPDIVAVDTPTANQTSSVVSLLLNRGDGTFAAPVAYNLGDIVSNVAVGDFNGDGNLDLASGGTQAILLPGRGDGTFYAPVDSAAGGFSSVAAGDFNGDGLLDLAGGSTVTVLLNKGDDVANLAGAAGFRISAPVAEGIARSTFSVTVTVVDAAGNPDPNFRGTVFLGSSDPLLSAPALSYTFTAADAGTHVFTGLQLFTVGAQSITAGAPFLPTTSTTITVTPLATRYLVSAPATATAGTPIAVTVTAADNAGNRATQYTGTIHFSSNDVRAGLPADYTFTDADAGAHTFFITPLTAGNDTISVTTPNTAMTGSATVSVGSAAASTLVLTGGSGPAGLLQPVTIVAQDPYGNVATGDNGTVRLTASDPLAILPASVTLAAGRATALVELRTVGTQSLSASDAANPAIAGSEAGVLVTPAVPNTFVVAGFPATTAGVTGTFTVSVVDSLNMPATGYTGTVVFSSSDIQAGLPARYTFTAADAGVHTFAATLRTAGSQSISVTDAAQSTITGTETGIAVSPAAAATLAVAGFPTITAGVAHGFTVTALDAFGNIATGYTGTIHLSSTDIQAGLPADYTFTAADAGIHLFSATLRTAGSQSISVADRAQSTIAGTESGIAVSPAAAASLAVAGFPATTAGVAHNFTVTALDAFGNVATGYTGTVAFSSSDLQAGLPASYTFTAADAGVHTFSAILFTAGTRSLTATDAANAAIAGTQAGISVVAATATHFVIIAPSSAVAGAAFSVTVTAVDAFGNVATGYLGKIHFSDTASNNGLPADYMFTAADAGIHTFTLTLKTTGLQTISVADSSTTSIKGSIGLTITPSGGGGGGGKTN